MSDFITIEDYKSTMHLDILQPMVRNDEQAIEDAETMAIEEVKGYLSGRYNVDEIFGTLGTNRNSFIVMVVKDIAIYHLSCLHNPQKFSQIRQTRYDQAIDKLERTQSGKYSPVGLPLKVFETPTQDTPEGGYLLSSNPKRDNHF